jgi:hypothetical protein
MNTFTCTHCQESPLATLCSDCLAEEICIRETRTALHIGRCHRRGLVDAEPCRGRAGSGKEMMTRAGRYRVSARIFHNLESRGPPVAPRRSPYRQNQAACFAPGTQRATIRPPPETVPVIGVQPPPHRQTGSDPASERAGPRRTPEPARPKRRLN